MRLASDANRRQDTSFHWSEALQRRNRVNWGKMLGVFSKAGAANRELALLWLECMRDALRETVPDESLRLSLEGAFWQMADHLQQASVTNGSPRA